MLFSQKCQLKLSKVSTEINSVNLLSSSEFESDTYTYILQAWENHQLLTSQAHVCTYLPSNNCEVI
jgi:hypothetical protein